MRRPTLLFAALVLLASLSLPAVALAAAPSNDDVSSARIVEAVPYADGPYDTTDTTSAPTDPGFCHAPDAGPDAATVWYSFTPEGSGTYAADTFGSDYDTTLYVGVPDGSGGIDVVACTDDTASGLQAAVQWDASAGTTYLIMVGTCCAGGTGDGGGQLEFHLDVAAPAPTVDVTVDAATRAPSGAVTIEGTIACTGDAEFAVIESFVTQRQGRLFDFGYGVVFLDQCTEAPSSWSSLIFPFEGDGFGGAKVTVQTTAFVCGAVECVSDSESAELRLEPARGDFAAPPVSPPVGRPVSPPAGPPVSPPAGQPKCNGPHPPPICPPVSPPVSEEAALPAGGSLGGPVALAATVPVAGVMGGAVGGSILAGMVAALRSSRRERHRGPDRG